MAKYTKEELQSFIDAHNEAEKYEQEQARQQQGAGEPDAQSSGYQFADQSEPPGYTPEQLQQFIDLHNQQEQQAQAQALRQAPSLLRQQQAAVPVLQQIQRQAPVQQAPLQPQAQIPVPPATVQQQAQAPQAQQQPPQTVLQGGITYTPGMLRTAQKLANANYPQPGDRPLTAAYKSLFLPVNQAQDGLAQSAEDLTNLGLGAAQQWTGVPQKQRMTAGDIIRKVIPDYVSPAEELNSPAYQQAMARSPMASGVTQAARFAGGMMLPVGAVEAAATKIPLLIQGAAKGLPAMARIGEAAQAVPVVQKLGQTMAALNRGAQYGQIQKLLRAGTPVAGTLRAALTGAGYGGAFAGGQRFGMTRDLGTVDDAMQNIQLGAALGAGSHVALNALAKFLTRRALQGHASASPMTEMPRANGAQSQPQQEAPSPEMLKAMIQKATMRNLMHDQASGGRVRTPEEKAATQHQYLDAFDKKYGNESDDHLKVVNQERGSFLRSQQGQQREQQRSLTLQNRTEERRNYAQSQTQERRQYSEAQKQERRRYQLSQQEAARNREAQNTGTGNDSYLTLRGQIETASSKEEMQNLWNDIHTQPAGPKGTRPLSSMQMSDLKSQWRKKFYNEYERDAEGGLGKSENGPGRKTPTSQLEKTAAEPSDGEEAKTIRRKIVGDFRKSLDVKKYGKREDRYKLCVSVDALADAAKLSREERAILAHQVEELANIRRSQTQHEMARKKLAQWCLENPDKWIGEQHDFSASQHTDETGLNQYIAIQSKINAAKKILLRAKVEEALEDASERQLEHVNVRKNGQIEPVIDPKPKTTFTTCGIAESYSETANGGLKVKGKLKSIEPEFTPPKSVDEVYKRAMQLHNAIEHCRALKSDLTGQHEDSGHSVTDIMQKVFDSLKNDWVDGLAPNASVWHVDRDGVVTAVEFRQAGMSIPGQQYHQPKSGVQYDIVKGRSPDWNRLNRLNSYFPGIPDLALATTLLGPEFEKLGGVLGKFRGLQGLLSGTISDILRANTRFRGQEVDDAFHRVNGEIAAMFLKDQHGEYYRPKDSEELTELLRDFKGEKVQRSSFDNKARKILEAQAEKEGFVPQDSDYSEALKRSRTALMIRQKYKALAKDIQPIIEEQEVRKEAAETGEASRAFLKIADPERDIDHEGKVRRSAYSPLYHRALNELHDSLLLKSGKADIDWGDLPGNFMTSLMANNPATALKNFFDQAPLTLAYFHKHLIQAAMDIHSNPEIAEHVNRLPSAPQAEMRLAKMKEAFKDTRIPDFKEEPAEALKYGMNWINYHLQTTLDPLFRGKSHLLSLADSQFHRYSSLASIYKSAETRGEDRHQFFEDLVSGNLPKETERAVMAEWSLGLSQTLNSVSPHLNKDLFAGGSVGKLTQAFATPGRRGMKLMEGWFKEARQSPESAAKLLGATLGLVALGGRGGIPGSAQMAYKTLGAMTGHNEDAEKNLENLDEMNMLRRVSGIDYSGSFGPDYATFSMPMIEAMEGMGRKLVKAAPEFAGDPVKAAWDTTKIVGFDGLAMVPRVGPFGYSIWSKLLRNLDSATAGQKDQWFASGFNPFDKVTIPDYNYGDALRNWLTGGIEPKAYGQMQEKRRMEAAKQDGKYSAGTPAAPSRDGAFIRSWFPNSSTVEQ